MWILTGVWFCCFTIVWFYSSATLCQCDCLTERESDSVWNYVTQWVSHCVTVVEYVSDIETDITGRLFYALTVRHCDLQCESVCLWLCVTVSGSLSLRRITSVTMCLRDTVCLTMWLITFLPVWLSDTVCLIMWLITALTVRQCDFLTECLTVWLSDCVTLWLCGRKCDWVHLLL